MQRRVVKVINTREISGRRELHFSSLEGILADAESFNASTVRAEGNWTPAQIVQHVAKLIRMSAVGFPPEAKVRWLVRVIARPLRHRVLRQSIRPGIRLPSGLRVLQPAPDVTWEEAMSDLREAVAVAQATKMTHRSPVLGPLTHDEWVKLHCRHAELHFSFLREGQRGDER